MYVLLIKNSNEVIDRIPSNSLKEAVSFFRQRKQMDEESFNNLYEVKEDAKKER